MSFVANSVDMEGLLLEYEKLIDNFRCLIAKVESGANIESTKLWKYKKELEKIDVLDGKDLAALIGIINKYRAVNIVFDPSSGIKLPGENLLKLLDGQPLIHDQGEEYNDSFFELSMAIRFAKRFSEYLGADFGIDMTGQCDVVFKNELAIECKYPHSKNKVRKRIAEGVDQVRKRVDEGLAPIGIVALDISNIIDKEKVWDFSQDVFDRFVVSYERLIKSRCVLSKEMRRGGLLNSILNDRYFQGIISQYVAHEAESVFYENLTFAEHEKLNRDVVAIAFQTNNYLCFEHAGNVVPVPCRSMGYYINKSLPRAYYHAVERMLHSLAVGI